MRQGQATARPSFSSSPLLLERSVGAKCFPLHRKFRQIQKDVQIRVEAHHVQKVIHLKRRIFPRMYPRKEQDLIPIQNHHVLKNTMEI